MLLGLTAHNSLLLPCSLTCKHSVALQLTERLPFSSPRNQDHMVAVQGSAYGWDDMQHLTDAAQRHQEWVSPLCPLPSAWSSPV